jgi:hypothetical protein
VVVHEEVATMLADAAVVDYERSLAAFRRIARRCALGDAAADDTELSEEHSRLRADADWLGLKVWARRRDARLRAAMDERIERYVAAAEPGTLVSLFASAPKEAETDPNGQVPFWLMALDAVRTAVFNALALLSTDPAARQRALAEVRSADSVHGRGTVAGLADLAFVRACLLDSVRLWPAAAMLVRVTATGAEWRRDAADRHGVDPRRRPASRASTPRRAVAPDLWLDGSAAADWQMNVFSRVVRSAPAGSRPPARHRQPLELLRQREFELVGPRLPRTGSRTE